MQTQQWREFSAVLGTLWAVSEIDISLRRKFSLRLFHVTNIFCTIDITHRVCWLLIKSVYKKNDFSYFEYPKHMLSVLKNQNII